MKKRLAQQQKRHYTTHYTREKKGVQPPRGLRVPPRFVFSLFWGSLRRAANRFLFHSHRRPRVVLRSVSCVPFFKNILVCLWSLLSRSSFAPVSVIIFSRTLAIKHQPAPSRWWPRFEWKLISFSSQTHENACQQKRPPQWSPTCPILHSDGDEDVPAVRSLFFLCSSNNRKPMSTVMKWPWFLFLFYKINLPLVCTKGQ